MTSETSPSGETARPSTNERTPLVLGKPQILPSHLNHNAIVQEIQPSATPIASRGAYLVSSATPPLCSCTSVTLKIIMPRPLLERTSCGVYLPSPYRPSAALVCWAGRSPLEFPQNGVAISLSKEGLQQTSFTLPGHTAYNDQISRALRPATPTQPAGHPKV